MPLVGLLKGKNKSYLFSDNTMYFDDSRQIRTSPRSFRIQKFKNFVVAYNSPYLQDLIDKFDFDSFPEPLTKSYLMRNFYCDFLAFLVDKTKCEFTEGAIAKSDFGIMIMGKDYCFDIGHENLYEVREFNAMENDSIAFGIHEFFKDKIDEEELVKEMMDKSSKYCIDVDYPFIMVESDDLDHLKIINEDGTVESKQLVQMWRKKNE